MKAEAKMKLAQLWLDRTEISLPHDVRVAAADIDVGQFVGPAELVGRASSFGSVYRTDALQVRAPIEQDSLAYLAPAIGRSATIRTASGTYDAVVERTAAIIGPKSRLARVFLKFAEAHPAETLPLPGTFVEVSIAGPVHDNVLVLPESAMQDRGSVWVVDGGALKAAAPSACWDMPMAVWWWRRSTRATASSSAPCRGRERDWPSRSAPRRRRNSGVGP